MKFYSILLGTGCLHETATVTQLKWHGDSVVMDHFPLQKGLHIFSMVEVGFKFAAHRGQQSGRSSQKKGHAQLQGSKLLTHAPEIPKPSPCSHQTRATLACWPGHCCKDTGRRTEALPMSPALFCLRQTLILAFLKSALSHSLNPKTCVTPRTFWIHTRLWGPLVNGHTPFAFLFSFQDLDSKLIHGVRQQILHQCPPVGHLFVIPPCWFPLFPIANTVLSGIRNTQK